MAEIEKFGAFETSPKKGYVSLRGKKQFAMVGPATNTQVEVGLNIKDMKSTARLIEQKPGGIRYDWTTPEGGKGGGAFGTFVEE